ncbi:TetR/AcrR family transcriptional regulator [Jatrophihabitans sp. DSM 45814]
MPASTASTSTSAAAGAAARRPYESSGEALNEDGSAEKVGLREQRRLNRARTSREHILDVAEALFGDQGYQATSLEQVAAGSEFSVGAVYKFFASKKELLGAVLTRRHEEMQLEVDEIFAASLPGLDELLALCSYYLDYFKLHPSFGRLTLRVYPAGLEPVSDYAEYSRSPAELNEMFIGAVERGQREGTIRTGDASWLATLVVGAIMFDHSLRYDTTVPQVPIVDLISFIRSAVAPSPVEKASRPRGSR